MRNSEKIELFGKDLFLFERNASDQLVLEASYKNNKGPSSIDFINQQAIIIRDSIKHNWINLPWYSIKKWRLQNVCNLKSIIDLPQRVILLTAKKVLEIEGTDSPYHRFLLHEITAEKFAEIIKKKAEELAILELTQ